MTPTKVTPIRLDKEQLAEAKRKQDEYGLPSLSALVRFAIKRLKKAPDPKIRSLRV